MQFSLFTHINLTLFPLYGIQIHTQYTASKTLCNSLWCLSLSLVASSYDNSFETYAHIILIILFY